MTAGEICNAAVVGKLTDDAAAQELVKLRYHIEVAREQIFIAKGGDDVFQSSPGLRRVRRMSRIAG